MKEKISKITSIPFLLIIGILFFSINVVETRADTAEELKSQITQLKIQIAELQLQLAELQSEVVAWCYDFKVNSKEGDSGTDVEALQTALEKEGFYKKEITGSFDNHTSSAVIDFQEKYKEDILAPWDLEQGTGYVGTTTRAKLNELYGCEKIKPEAKVEEPEPEVQAEVETTEPVAEEAETESVVEEQAVEQTEAEVGVKAGADTSYIEIISPDGGESWYASSKYNITWVAGVSVNNVRIIILRNHERYCDAEGNCFEDIVTSNSGSYKWTVPYGFEGGDSVYTVKIEDAADASIFDESEDFFSIKAIYSPLGLENIEVHLASVSNAMSQITEILKKLIGQ